jgi:hypothetical protein
VRNVKRNLTLCVKKLFPKICPVLEYVEKYGTGRQFTDAAHTHIMLDK